MSKTLGRSAPVFLPKVVLALSFTLRMYVGHTVAIFSPGGSGLLPMQTKLHVAWQEEDAEPCTALGCRLCADLERGVAEYT